MTNDVKTTLKGKVFNQFGREVLVTQIPFMYLETLFEIDELVQRKLDIRKRNQIAEFILDAVTEDTFYFSPFIFSARGAIETEGDKWIVTPGSKLYILDGQHRASGLSVAMKKLEMKIFELESRNKTEIEIRKKKNQLERLKNYPISMQVYLNIEQVEERQLFTDINMERKDVHGGLIVKYDQRDPYAVMSKEIANELSNYFEIEYTNSRITAASSALTSLTIIRRCLLILFEGQTQLKENHHAFKSLKLKDAKEIASAFFKMWLEIFPKQASDRERYVSGYTGIHLALAYSVFLLTRNGRMAYIEAIESLKKISCSWKHDDPMFEKYYHAEKKRTYNLSSSGSIHYVSYEFIKQIKEGGMSYDVQTKANHAIN